MTNDEYNKIKHCTGIYHVEIWQEYFKYILERDITVDETLTAIYRINEKRLNERFI